MQTGRARSQEVHERDEEVLGAGHEVSNRPLSASFVGDVAGTEQDSVSRGAQDFDLGDDGRVLRPARLDYDYKNPNYQQVVQQRTARLLWLREDKTGQRFVDAAAYYKDHIAEFINDWGQTFDPRNIADAKPTKIPFILFPKQYDLINWMVGRWKASDDGLCDKSREMGVSWITVSVIDSLCIFYPGFVGGFGSRKQEYVDKTGDPKALFWKAREFLAGLPPEFRGGWTRDGDAHCRISFGNGSSITGEAGDNIGRGDRASIYIVDEAAFIEHPELIDASLSQTTRCRIDVSSANGMANPFARKRHSWSGERLFTFHWRDDPRKDEAWYEKQKSRFDEIVVASEIDINYHASVAGVLIPSVWVQAAIDAHIKLKWEDNGRPRGALDVADEGPDKNAFAISNGSVVKLVEDWSGKDSNLFRTAQTAMRYCDEHGLEGFVYDGDGMGVSLRGDVEVINAQRKASGQPEKSIESFRGSGAVRFPEREDVPGRINKNQFQNRKAQDWWSLRVRFEKTFKAVTEGLEFHQDEMISLSSDMARLIALQGELSQVIYGYNTLGKLGIIKTPDGMASPNMADTLMMLFGTSDIVSESMFAKSDLMLNTTPVPYPTQTDTIFATICTWMRGGRDNDGAGVVFWAHEARDGQPLVVLGWDIHEMDSTLIDYWLPTVFNNLDSLARVIQPRFGAQGVYVKDDSAGEVLFHAAVKSGRPVGKIESELKDDARALATSVYVKNGAVRLSAAAMEQAETYKGAKKNHLISQIESFHAGAKDVEAQILLNAFTHGIALSQGNVDGY